jgi:hypothetical protein
MIKSNYLRSAALKDIYRHVTQDVDRVACNFRGEKLMQEPVWDVTNIRISQYEISLFPIKRRLFADPSQKRLRFDPRPSVTCDGPSDYGTSASLSSSSCTCHCNSTIALSAINSYLSSNVCKYIPVEVWDTPTQAGARLLRLKARIPPKAWKFCVL